MTNVLVQIVAIELGKNWSITEDVLVITKSTNANFSPNYVVVGSSSCIICLEESRQFATLFDMKLQIPCCIQCSSGGLQSLHCRLAAFFFLLCLTSATGAKVWLC